MGTAAYDMLRGATNAGARVTDAAPATMLNRIVEATGRLRNQTDEMHELVSRLSVLADQMVGPVPEESNARSADPKPGNACTDINEAVIQNARAIERLRSVAARFGA